MVSLRGVENLLEGLVEGSIGRLFRSALQPAEVAKKLERAMEEHYVVAVDGVIVPNAYEVLLHPQDLAALTAAQPGLAGELAQWLREVAREERYRFVGPLRVRLVASETVRRRLIQVRAATVEAGDGAAAEPVTTRDYRVVRTVAEGPACRLKLLTGPEAGRVYLVAGPATAIGRAPDNDLVIDASDVSRHHARLELAGGGYRLVDLDSTNGTRVNGRRISEQALLPGDVLRLGATELAFQAEEAAEAGAAGGQSDAAGP